MTISIYNLLKFMVLVSLATSCDSTDKVYEASKVTSTVDLDGLANESAWGMADELVDFSYPWHDVEAPRTKFKAMHNGEFLYFYYYVEDKDIRLKQTGDEEMDAVASDRAEIFMRSSDTSKPYYAFEMDPLGRVFDSKGEFGEYIDQDYDFPRSSFGFKGNIKEDSYTLEGKFSLAKLREMGLLVDDTIMIGLFRGEYSLGDNGKEQTRWISWVIPDSKTPNFHIPSSFGKLKLK